MTLFTDPPDPRPVLVAKLDRRNGHSLRVLVERAGGRPVVRIETPGGSVSIQAGELRGVSTALDLATDMIRG